MRTLVIFIFSSKLLACPELHYLFQVAADEGVEAAVQTIRGPIKTLDEQMDAIARIGYHQELTGVSKNKWLKKVKKKLATQKEQFSPTTGDWLEIDIAETLAKEFPLEFEAFSRRFPATPHVYTDSNTGQLVRDYPTLPNSKEVMTFETDVELSCCIIEVTNYSGDAVEYKARQLRRFLDPTNREYQNINPREKPVILYAPGHTSVNTEVYKDLATNPQLTIVSTKEELLTLIRDMRK